MNIDKAVKALHEYILNACEQPTEDKEQDYLSADLKFNFNELNQMPFGFRMNLILCGGVVHVLKYYEDNEAFYYELRFSRNGYNVKVFSRDLAEAKRLFIDEVNERYL